jgi:phosphoglycolate phosphatase-like HAD superfamily hydrolase
LFALITGFEMIMAAFIRQKHPEDRGWLKCLAETRQQKVEDEKTKAKADDSYVDTLPFTQFCDDALRNEHRRRRGGSDRDQLIPVFLSADDQRDHGEEQEWRGNRFKTEYLPLVRPFSAVPELLRRGRDAGLQIAGASSAKESDIARIIDLVHLTTSSGDVDESKPAPDVFKIVLKKLKIDGADAVAMGDTPHDAEAAGKAGVRTVGVLCDGFTEDELRKAGCTEVHPGPDALLACFERSLLRNYPVVGPR